MSGVGKPSALIFGGLNTCSRALAALLVPPEGEPLVSHLRIVDRFSVSPPTTYLGAEFPRVLARPEVEYRQANLTVSTAVISAFDPPAKIAPYSYVFDLTGELSHERGEAIVIKTTLTVARNIALEAARRNVKAYVRLQQPLYKTSADGKSVTPVRTLGFWWHETLRMLASIENLNLVILRIGFVYGPYVEYGLYALLITVASVYGFMKKPMTTIWEQGGQDPVHTIHVEDVVSAMWSCAGWMGSLGRKQADLLAGEKIPFLVDDESGKERKDDATRRCSSVIEPTATGCAKWMGPLGRKQADLLHEEKISVEPGKRRVEEVTGRCSSEIEPIAPIFDLVDDSGTTLAKDGPMIAGLFGTTFEFYSRLMLTVARIRFEDIGEEINQHHVGNWTKMCQISKPVVTNTPLNAYMDKYALSEHRLGYKNDKLKRVVQYRLKRPQFCRETIIEVVDKWKAEGSWPVLDERE